jgi:hypothetical protein
MWHWQCDLHDGEEARSDEYGDGGSMEEAFAAALAHAAVCSEVWRDEHTHDSRESRDACEAGHCDHSTMVFVLADDTPDSRARE